jgi:TPR repeat protein
MNNLAIHYEYNGNIELAIKYYLMAIEKGNSIAMNSLAIYYKNDGNIELAVKYYIMARAGRSVDCCSATGN